MSDNSNDLALPPASPASPHTVTYDSAATHSDDEESQNKQPPQKKCSQSDKEESPQSPQKERCPYSESESPAAAGYDERTFLQQLQENDQLVDFTLNILSEFRDLSDSVHAEDELLKSHKLLTIRSIENLARQVEYAKNSIHRTDALMQKMKTESESRDSTRDHNNGGSSSDSARSKRQKH